MLDQIHMIKETLLAFISFLLMLIHLKYISFIFQPESISIYVWALCQRLCHYYRGPHILQNLYLIECVCK
jgi:hypothetical protein